MDDLIAFLRARIDEDEADALAVGGDKSWFLYLEGGQDGWAVEGQDTGELGCIVGSEALGHHIVRHDPARVLADVAAKRQIIELHSPDGDFLPACKTCSCAGALACMDCHETVEWPCPTAKMLALPYADHPDYRQEWRP